MTLYITRGTLASLCAERSLDGFCLMSAGGGGRLRMVPKPGHLVRYRAGTPLDVLFEPGHIVTAWTAADGSRQARRIEANGDDLFDLVNDPLSLFRPGTDGAAAPCPDDPAPHAFGFDRETFAMLLRHAAIGDMLFGSDGRECTFQFQVAHGFAGTCDRPPRDWIGVEFSDHAVELGWFDWNGTFRMRSLQLPRDMAEAARLAADPLSPVMRDGIGANMAEAEAGIAGLMKRLEAGFADPR